MEQDDAVNSALPDSAVRGDPQAQYELADALCRKEHLPAAKFWYRKAANAGHVPAMVALAVCIKKSDDRDTSESEFWLQRAASAGHSLAMGYVGSLEFDRGNLVESERWHRKAAEVGNKLS